MRFGGQGGFPLARAGTICDSWRPRCSGCTATAWTHWSSAAARRGTIATVGQGAPAVAQAATSRPGFTQPACSAVSRHLIKVGGAKGLARKQVAPAFIALARRFSSGNAVMKMNGAL